VFVSISWVSCGLCTPEKWVSPNKITTNAHYEPKLPTVVHFKRLKCLKRFSVFLQCALASCAAVYCNRSCLSDDLPIGFVCVFVCLWVCGWKFLVPPNCQRAGFASLWVLFLISTVASDKSLPQKFFIKDARCTFHHIADKPPIRRILWNFVNRYYDTLSIVISRWFAVWQPYDTVWITV